VLLLDERIRSDGALARTWAGCDGDRLRIVERDGDGDRDTEIGELALIAVDAVMRRYGRPLDPDVALDGEALACGIFTLRRLRYCAAVDADGRDYLVWQRPGDEPVACLAATATAALRFLAARAAPTDERTANSAPSGN
jgi:hypothetical protein